MVKSKGIVFHINKKVFDYDKFAEYLNDKSEKITEVLNNDEKNLPFHFTKVFSEVYQLDKDDEVIKEVRKASDIVDFILYEMDTYI